MFRSQPGQDFVQFSRGTILAVVPHSCRFGAGYKSNGRPHGGQPRAMFLMRCFVPDTILPTERTLVIRESHRGAYDRETIDKILDEGYVCHVGFSIDGQPYVIPTLYARIGDAVYFHGSAASRMLRNASAGISVCITVTLTDGFVLARSVFNHSMNYRSVVALGKELKATSILRLPLAEVSAKIRSGPVEDDAPDYALPVWAGIIPLSLTPGAPIRDAKCDPGIPAPAYATHYKR